MCEATNTFVTFECKFMDDAGAVFREQRSNLASWHIMEPFSRDAGRHFYWNVNFDMVRCVKVSPTPNSLSI